MHTLTTYTGTIQPGKRTSRNLWFPTVNIHCGHINLPSGTYKVNVEIDHTCYHGLWPYFAQRGVFEVHLLDTDTSDYYHKEATIYPLCKIRENKSFNSRNELVTQIQDDIQRINTHPRTVMTFGTFDHVHPWHTYYLDQAKKRGDKLITIIARDKSVLQIKGRRPDHDEQTRSEHIQKLQVADVVVLWNLTDHMAIVRSYQPEVICLWYDQQVDEQSLLDNCINAGRHPYIIRIWAHQPDKYKSSLIKETSGLYSSLG
jgi:cytidyltransferase-like protein